MSAFLRAGKASAAGGRAFSTWSHLPMAPPDKILGLNEKFNADTFPQKISLGVGAYRDDDGKPFVLKSIKEAEARIMSKAMGHEYTGITGVPAFVKVALEFAYGENSEPIQSNRIAAAQSISGTGGCRLAGEFVKTFFGAMKIHIPNPTWGNHLAIFRNCGLEPVYYKYYDAASKTVDFSGMKSDIMSAEDGSLFMLHSCAHNPTGCDPTPAQWDELSILMKQKKHIVFFDCAYQGFASGDAEADAYSLRKFIDDGHFIMLSQSFAKNFGLYGERVGCFSVVCSDTEEAQKVTSQIKLIVRAMYSNPPIHGARIVAEVLTDPELKAQWYVECKGMADRILEMRTLLRSKLEAGSSLPWNHVTDQIGMFCFTGLSPEQVLRLREEFHIYCTDDGRFSMAGINTKNIDYLSQSVIAVL
ncbi:aspartate aminotransferase [Ochromonadaceae sp. CCMP2298]|nr:aspartate aminotransferase [Ochromonadaceae sp. CCMP2298]KAJ1443787.1 aspartate aminotransferase [Ochromonadaceae sp. CCMP2298]|mmetsp:Transcript_28907/g.64173  ORF Transcript_28907/g.64173 Transcript_28907/m.64173 type:complete len:416 (-) Transcript_28907:1496-2743(-)